MKIFDGNKFIKNAVFVFTVTDEEFDYIKENPNYYLDREFAAQILKSNGNNVVFTFCTCEDEKILPGIKKFLKSYDRVGWWNRGHTKFYMKENKNV